MEAMLKVNHLREEGLGKMPRDFAEEMGMTQKRLHKILGKYAKIGLVDSGVTLRTGWITFGREDEVREELKK